MLNDVYDTLSFFFPFGIAAANDSHTNHDERTRTYAKPHKKTKSVPRNRSEHIQQQPTLCTVGICRHRRCQMSGILHVVHLVKKMAFIGKFIQIF